MPQNAALDRLTRLAARVLGTPASLVTLFEGDRRVLKSFVGLPESPDSSSTPSRDDDLCAYVAVTEQLLAVTDTRLEPRFRDLRIVQDWEIHAYAGHPLQLDGKTVGVLSVFAPEPREWTDEELEILRDLAESVVAELGWQRELARRERVEEALRASEERYRTLVELSSDGIFLESERGEILECNEAGCRIYGYAKEEMVGLSIADLVPKEFADMLPEIITEDTGGIPLERVGRRKDGSLFDAEIATRLYDVGGERRLIAYVRDITERKLDEEAVHRSEEQFRALVDNTPDLIARYDTDLRHLYLNPAAEQLTGTRADSFLGRTNEEAGVPERRARLWRQKLQRVLETRKEEQFEYDMVVTRGHIHLETRLIPELTADGSVESILEVTRDITKQKRSEAMLTAKTDVLDAISRGEPLLEVLDLLVRSIEAQISGLQMSVLLLRDERLWFAAGSTLPEAYSEAINGVQIGPATGSCGTAAYFGTAVVASDIATDPRWADYRDLALSHGLRACWSQPILSGNGEVLGTFAAYYNEVGAPSLDEIRTVARAASLAGIAIERTRSNDALRVAEAHYRRLVETSPHGVYVLDKSGRFIEMNPALETILGHDKVEILGRTFDEVVILDGLDQPMHAFQQIIDEATTDLEMDLQIRHASGELRMVSITATTIAEDNNIIGMHGIARDVTEQRATATALRESEGRFRALVENIQEVITILNADGTTQYISPAFEWITDYKIEERVGRSAFEIVHPDDVEMVRAKFRDLLTQPGSSTRIEISIQRKDGSWRKVDMVGQNLLHDPSVQGVVVTYQDITERRHLEEQLRQAQKMDAVGRLAGGVSHDFNNLLNVIGGIAHLMLMTLPEESELQADLREITDAVRQGASLTQQLLAFSRQQMIQPQVLDVGDEVQETCKMLRRVIGDDIELNTVLHSHGHIKADPGQLIQVLMNLALNARDAMPEGGAITIETREAVLSEATARRHPYPLQAGPYVEISVRDTGYGMDEATLGHVFEPFFTTKGPGKGTGLGLSTVYGIVKQSGGFLRVESTSGEGATFRVYLPRVFAEPKHSAPTQRALPIANGETILVVEDEPAMRMVTRRLLENTGYHVLEAAGGEEALRMVSEHEGKIDLVLTDVVMPGISGAVLAKCLLALYPDLCVLYMSGYTDDQVIRHGLQHEQVHFLQKPFDAEQLGRRVREALGEG